MKRCALLLALMTGPVAADSLVLGAAHIPDYLGSDDRRTAPLIIARYTGSAATLEFDGNEARFDLNTDKTWRLGPLMGVSMGRGDSIESAAVAALPGFETAIDLGIYGGFTMPYGALPEGELSGFVSARRAVSGQRSGAILRGYLDYFFAAARFLRFLVNVEINVADSEHMSTHFSIEEPGTSGLPPYSADAGLRDVGFGITNILSFSRTYGLYTRVSTTHYLGEAADSPVVALEGERTTWLFGIGGVIVFR